MSENQSQNDGVKRSRIHELESLSFILYLREGSMNKKQDSDISPNME